MHVLNRETGYCIMKEVTGMAQCGPQKIKVILIFHGQFANRITWHCVWLIFSSTGMGVNHAHENVSQQEVVDAGQHCKGF